MQNFDKLDQITFLIHLSKTDTCNMEFPRNMDFSRVAFPMVIDFAKKNNYHLSQKVPLVVIDGNQQWTSVAATDMPEYYEANTEFYLSYMLKAWVPADTSIGSNSNKQIGNELFQFFSQHNTTLLPCVLRFLDVGSVFAVTQANKQLRQAILVENGNFWTRDMYRIHLHYNEEQLGKENINACNQFLQTFLICNKKWCPNCHVLHHIDTVLYGSQDAQKGFYMLACAPAHYNARCRICRYVYSTSDTFDQMLLV